MTDNGDTTSIEITAEEEGGRLDQTLAARLNGPSRSRIKKLIEQGHVSLAEGAMTDPSYRVKSGDWFRVELPKAEPAVPKAQRMDLKVAYEDEDVIVVDKPAGMVVHPAAGNWTGTLVNALLYHCRDSLSGVGGVLRPGIVHRLDKDTTGLIVAAKNDQAHAGLRDQFDRHTIDRAYQAIIWGSLRPLVGTIDAPLMKKETDHKRVVVAQRDDHPNARRAVTHYKTLKRYGDLAEPAASLVECRLETGRTHQIRVHLFHKGCPLIGDAVYGQGRKLLAKPEKMEHSENITKTVENFRRQALHAYQLGFRHPISGKKIELESTFPKDIKRLSQLLDSL